MVSVAGCGLRDPGAALSILRQTEDPPGRGAGNDERRVGGDQKGDSGGGRQQLKMVAQVLLRRRVQERLRLLDSEHHSSGRVERQVAEHGDEDTAPDSGSLSGERRGDQVIDADADVGEGLFDGRHVRRQTDPVDLGEHPADIGSQTIAEWAQQTVLQPVDVGLP